MAMHTMTFRGMTRSEASNSQARTCEIKATIAGDSYSTSTVEVHFNQQLFFQASQQQFHHFCEAAKGKPPRLWRDAIALNDGTLKVPTKLATDEQNLLKALFLVYVWIEPILISRPTTPFDDILLDEILVDYTGAFGVQPFLYFLPAEYQNSKSQQAAVIRKLFELRLLCQMEATISKQTLLRWFTPLVIPSLLVDHFGERPAERHWNYDVWRTIKSRRQVTVQRLARRGG